MSNTPIRIVMVAQLNTPPYEPVTWIVYNAPDNTGAQSGFPPNTLINIAVDSVSAPSGSVNPITLTVGGDLSGTLPNPTVAKIQGKAVSSATPTSGQALIWNGTTWVPTTYTSVGGDLSGSLPNPTVAKIQTRAVSSSAPSSGDGLVWNGTNWAPTAVPSASVGGDLSGTLPNPTVVKIQGHAISNTAPSANQALVWNGSAWAPNSLTVIGQVWASFKVDSGVATVVDYSSIVLPVATYISPGIYTLSFPMVAVNTGWSNFSGNDGNNVAGMLISVCKTGPSLIQVSCFNTQTGALADPPDPDDQLISFVI